MKDPRHVGAENISDAAFITSTQHRDLSCPMSSLQGYVDRRVELILQDGRVIIVSSTLLDNSKCLTLGDLGHLGWL